MSYNFIESLLGFILSPFTIISVSFWILMYVLIRISGKKKVATNIFFFPFLAMVGTRRLNNFLKKASKWHPKFWRVFWSIGFFVSFCFIIIGLWFIFYNLISLLFSPSVENAIVPLIPGVTIGLPQFAYLILPILFVATVHEFSHAMAAGADDIDIVSTGIFGVGFVLVIGFGAFVEVDERSLSAKPRLRNTRLRIAAAGTFSNAIQAGIGILLLLSFVSLLFPFYGPRVFQITEVSHPLEGGYNYDNLDVGDVVTAINGTTIDIDNGIDLDEILLNKTLIKCSVGDSLIFFTYNPVSNKFSNKTIVLGKYNFIGITYTNTSNDKLEIRNVYTALQGGNNYDKGLLIGAIVTKINDIAVDMSKNITIDYLLASMELGDTMKLTLDNGSSYFLDVDAAPLVPGAFVFDNIYLGFTYEDSGGNNIRVSRVLKNLTEDGINEGILEAGDQIIEIAGVKFQSESKDFKEIVETLSLIPGEKIKFKINRNQEIFEVNANSLKIPTKYVKIGILDTDYWMPKNVFSAWLSGLFPAYLYEQLLWFIVIATSMTLFNMLPVPVFDGDRIVKEIINSLVGQSFDSNKKKKEKLYYNKDETRYPLREYRVNNISEVKLIAEGSEVIIGKDNYDLIDTIGDGFNDAFVLKLPENSKINEASILEVSYDYQYDSKLPKKKKILNTIRIITTVVFLANIILSIINFGSILSLFNL